MAARPNIILIMTDQQLKRPYFSPQTKVSTAANHERSSLGVYFLREVPNRSMWFNALGAPLSARA